MAWRVQNLIFILIIECENTHVVCMFVNGMHSLYKRQCMQCMVHGYCVHVYDIRTGLWLVQPSSCSKVSEIPLQTKIKERFIDSDSGAINKL